MADETPRETSSGVDGMGKKAIRFDYIKSNFFRVIHADGIFGGISPRRKICISIWNERWPIPKQMSFELAEDGKLRKEIRSERVQRDAVVREVEVCIMMDLENAKSFHDWLGDKIKKIEQVDQK